MCIINRHIKKGGNMKYSELKKLLRNNGSRFDHEAGRHEMWYSSVTGLYFPISRHNTEDCPKGTLSSILKDAGIKIKR